MEVDMKNLTAERKGQSLYKWLEIRDNILNKIKINYIVEYWNGCGFCEAAYKTSRELKRGSFANTCIFCSLIINNICYDSKHLDSSVFLTLNYANNHEWNKALVCCEKVINAIKRTRIDKDEK